MGIERVDYKAASTVADYYKNNASQQQTQRKKGFADEKQDVYERTITDETLEKMASNEDDKIAVGNNSKSEEPQLSEAAQKLLEELRQKYGNTDFIVANYGSEEEAKQLLAGGKNEYSVLIEPELLEKMAADRSVRNKYEQIIIDSQTTFINIESQVQAQGGEIQSLGMSIDENGMTTFFADIQKSNAKHAASRARKMKAEQAAIQKRIENRRTKRKEEEKATAEKNAKIKEDKPDEEQDDVTTIKANSAEELLTKINDFLKNSNSESEISEDAESTQTAETIPNYTPIDYKL